MKKLGHREHMGSKTHKTVHNPDNIYIYTYMCVCIFTMYILFAIIELYYVFVRQPPTNTLFLMAKAHKDYQH